MAHVITQPCIGVKSGDCVAVCPVDCIHPKKGERDFGHAKMLYIDPATCIDCGACAIACPVDAIFDEDDVPAEWAAFDALNEAYYKRGLAAATPPKQRVR